MDKPLVNRVAQSGIITLNLEEDFPKAEFVHFDLKDYLFMEMILKEKDFRTALKEHDWEAYKGKTLLVYCSIDAIIPHWAFMLVASKSAGIADDVYQGNQEAFLSNHYQKVLQARSYEEYQGKRVVIKGCSQHPVPVSAYLELTKQLSPFAQSIMYGEPCSTVPIFKRPRVINRS